MNLPFQHEKEDWKPRVQIGRDKTLTPLENQILDTFDVVDQRVTWYGKLAILAINLALAEGFIILLYVGPDLIKLLRKVVGMP